MKQYLNQHFEKFYDKLQSLGRSYGRACFIGQLRVGILRSAGLNWETWPLLRARATPLKSALPKPTQTKSRVRSQSMRTLFKFAHELKAGDIVIYPSKGEWLTLGG